MAGIIQYKWGTFHNQKKEKNHKCEKEKKRFGYFAVIA